MQTDIKAFIIKLLEAKGTLPKNQDLDDYRYLDNGHIDSLSLIKFINNIELEYDIELNDDEIMSENFRTVSGLTSLLENKCNQLTS